ncbi:MAG TPA: DUF2959 family protein, partial [Planctomycetota bacterium]|nr:DUF2959 family protein [Planctomycetota bacterium]
MSLVTRPATTPFALALCVGVLALSAGCAGPKTEGQKKMSQLSEQMQSLGTALEASKAQLQKTLEAHDLLVANADADLSGNFSRFQSSIETCNATQKKIGTLMDQISATSIAYFAGWEADLARIDNSELRQSSEARMAQVKSRLEQVQSQIATTKAAFEPLMQVLNDHLVYLSNDLTLDAVASLAKDSAKLRQDVGSVYTAIDQGVPP